MPPFAERRATAFQVSLVAVGASLALFYAHQLPTLMPPLSALPPDAVSAALNDWSTVQLGLGLVAFGLALPNQSALRRVRILRLSRGQRLAAAGCGFALTSPWVTAFVAGLALGFRDPYATLWSLAFLAGSAGAAGLTAVAAWRIADLSFRSTEQVPYVGVDASRREAIRGAGAAVVGTGTVAASLALGDGPLAESRPAYRDRSPVVYERADLRVRPVGDAARLGGSATFAVTNTGDETIGLGCHVPWALQALDDGYWHHVTWTPGRFYNMCATPVGPGSTRTVTVPLSGAAMTREDSVTSDPTRDLTPGTYRLVLVGTHPYLAVNFQVLPEA